MEKEEKRRFYYGIDLGDGESAVARMTSLQPEILAPGGEKSILTALAVMEDGTLRIGESACQQQPGMKEMHVRFKQRFLLGDDEAERSIERFARALYKRLEADGTLTGDQDARFLIGCPSGWDTPARERYCALFERAGFKAAQGTSESRAAFLAAREAGLLSSDAQTQASSLIIDAGSSTTDFTFVTRWQVTDSGQVNLGAGLIDRALLDMNLARDKKAKKLSAHLREFPQYMAHCELAARRVKEMLFRARAQGIAHTQIPCETAVKLYTLPDRPTVDIACTDAEMDALLQAPMEELAGKSYIAAYREALQGLAAAHREEMPSTVLMTGGASRMDFMRTVAEEVFPGAKIVMGAEPEFAIARGLCYALHLDEQTAGFSAEARRVLAPENIAQMVRAALPDLYTRIAPPLVDALSTQVAPAVFSAWRRGEYRDLTGMQEALAREASAYFSPETLRVLLAPQSKAWLGDLRRRLQTITDPLCEKYALPVTALRLPEDELLLMDMGDLSPTGRDLFDFSAMKLLSDIIAATLAATVLGGGGMALLMSGPLGLVVGAAAGVLASRALTGVAERLLWRADIPLPLRKAFSVRAFEARLAGRREEMIAALAQKMQNAREDAEDDAAHMVEGITQAVRTQMEENLRSAIVLLH